MERQRYYYTNFPNVKLNTKKMPVKYTRHAIERTKEKSIPVITEFDGRKNKLVEIDIEEGKVVKYLYEVERENELYTYALIDNKNEWLVKTVWSNKVGEHTDSNRKWDAYTFANYMLNQETKQLKRRK